ncbi:MAG: PLDc_N domain-containing protein [Gemmatimonadota bacterium]|nr:MAG: PLDc_N domain-containing protein [Gemmatimonadota bacterium]
MGISGGLWGLVLLIADIWALLNIWQSRESTGGKILWTVLILVLPFLGFIVWLLFGPKK